MFIFVYNLLHREEMSHLGVHEVGTYRMPRLVPRVFTDETYLPRVSYNLYLVTYLLLKEAIVCSRWTGTTIITLGIAFRAVVSNWRAAAHMRPSLDYFAARGKIKLYTVAKKQ